MKEVLKFEDKPLEIVEKKSHLRLRPLRRLRERRTINTKHEQIPTTRGTNVHAIPIPKMNLTRKLPCQS